jgi:hypothetical protein
MPTTRFTVHTRLSPREVLTLLTDFGPGRTESWPGIDEAHFRVHEVAPTWAEVTEGNAMGWERERYEWDAEAGTVTITTLDSNLWAAGSGWRYEITPAGDGSDLHVTLHRVGRTWRARLLGAVIPVAGPRVLAKQFRSVLARAEAR